LTGDQQPAEGGSGRNEPSAGDPSADDWGHLSSALAIVRERTGVDFGGYRPHTLLRRVRNRMIGARERSLAQYLERLRSDPEEADALLEKLTIKVSRFFRHASAFEALGTQLETRRAACPDSRLSAWSAGCGQGEEAYSLAILMDELGQAWNGPDVLGTDVDAHALERASRGVYPPESLVEVSPARRGRYFRPVLERTGPALAVQPFLRARVDLRPGDLTAEERLDGAVFDVVCCRNVLIYLQPAAQLRVQERLASSLRPGGLLCLGEAEWLLPPLADRFEVVSRKARLFARVDDGVGRE
jgi:chemotaxis methyl-accepting protein methylase